MARELCVSDMEKAFAMFDHNKDGRITRDELEVVFKEAKVQPTSQQLDEFFSRIDTDGNGAIDFGEFCCIVKDIMFAGAAQSQLKRMRTFFEGMDLNGDGKIDAHELKTVLEKMTGEPVEDEVVADIITAVDTDKDGDINFNEFVTMVKMLRLDV